MERTKSQTLEFMLGFFDAPQHRRTPNIELFTKEEIALLTEWRTLESKLRPLARDYEFFKQRQPLLDTAFVLYIELLKKELKPLFIGTVFRPARCWNFNTPGFEDFLIKVHEECGHDALVNVLLNISVSGDRYFEFEKPIEGPHPTGKIWKLLDADWFFNFLHWMPCGCADIQKKAFNFILGSQEHVNYLADLPNCPPGEKRKMTANRERMVEESLFWYVWSAWHGLEKNVRKNREKYEAIARKNLSCDPDMEEKWPRYMALLDVMASVARL